VAIKGGHSSSSSFPKYPRPQLQASNSNSSQGLNHGCSLTPLTNSSQITTECQSVKNPSGSHDQFFFSFNYLQEVAGLLIWAKGWVCSLQVLLGLASAVFLRLEPNRLMLSIGLLRLYINKKNKLHGLSPRANYTDRATAACRRSGCQLLRTKGATWSA
jgi:hypothetical protein